MSDDRRPLPWSGWCFVCGDDNPSGLGVRFVVEGEEVRVDTVLGSAFEGYPGHVHGGVITALLDETVGWACTVRCGRFCLTAELKVRFRHPIHAGEEVVVRGRCDGESSRLLRGHGWIEDAHGKVLATAEGIFAPISREQHDAVLPQLRMPGGRPAGPEDI